ncbi:MAG: hypothetical protein PHE48_00350 [Candidatus Daviesbacteria bacterium]|nr:hypothetical protein [Candidatus Daviesbacteria bacterium]
MAWVIICLASAVSSLFAPDIKNFKAPHRKYITTSAVAIENIGGTKSLVAFPNEVIPPKPNFSSMLTRASRIGNFFRTVALL